MSNFEDHIIDLFETIHPLDRIGRAGYVLRGVTEPESVAAHSHFVSLLALLFAERFPDTFNGEKALAMALTHDLPEARLMDIPMPAGDAYLADSKDQAEQHIIEEMMRAFDAKYAEYHQELLDAASPEAQLIRGLDKAQMMLKVLMYQQENRGRLEEFWRNPKNFNDFGLPQVSALFDAICARAGRERPR